MLWSLILCSTAVYVGFAILVGKIFATDDRALAGLCRAAPIEWGEDADEDDAAPPSHSVIEDELETQSWSDALHALFLPEAL